MHRVKRVRRLWAEVKAKWTQLGVRSEIKKDIGTSDVPLCESISHTGAPHKAKGQRARVRDAFGHSFRVLEKDLPALELG